MAKVASHKVVSKHIARVPVHARNNSYFAVNMCSRKHPNKLNLVQNMISKLLSVWLSKPLHVAINV